MATNNCINAPLPISAANGGTGVASPTIHGILVAQGASAMSPLVLTNGQVLIGSTGADPVAASLTAGSNITITPGAGTITIASPDATTVWSAISAATKTIVANEGYISNNGAGVTYTLPATATLGDVFEIVGPQAWTVAQNAGQSIKIGSSTTTTGTGGSLASTNAGDTLRVVCSDATGGAEVFRVLSFVGNITVV